jgi:hypothetical protein
MFMLTSIEDSTALVLGSQRAGRHRETAANAILIMSPLWGLVISLYDITSMRVERHPEMGGALFTVIFRWWCSALRKQVVG